MMIAVKFIFALIFLSCVSVAKIELDGDVLVLDDSNFDEAVAKHELLLVEFYAPWCGHCKTLAPEWAKAATTLKENALKLAKCDATEAKDLATKFGVSGFPTIKFFKKGVPSDFEGGRTEKDIVSWVNKKTGPPAITVNTEDEFDKLEKDNDAVAVGVFSDLASDSAKAFLAYAGSTAVDIPFIITSAEPIRSKLGVTKDSVVILTKIEDSLRADFEIVSATIDEKGLDSLITTTTTPLIQEFTQAAAKKIFGSEIKKHALIFIKKDADKKPIFAEVKATAEEFKGKLLFITIDDSNANILKYFDLTENDLPKLIVADMTSQMKKFPLPGDFKAAAINTHVKAFIEGTLKPVLKSEEPSPEDLEEPVKILKGKSFKEIVLDNDNDVFVEIYAPWCGHCKKLAPIYDELAEHFEDNQKIVIAKMDGTTNEIDIEGFEAQGYPSLFFKNGETKEVVKYEGGRELDDLIKYIEQNAPSFGKSTVDGAEKTSLKDEL